MSQIQNSAVLSVVFIRISFQLLQALGAAAWAALRALGVWAWGRLAARRARAAAAREEQRQQQHAGVVATAGQGTLAAAPAAPQVPQRGDSLATSAPPTNQV